MKKLKSRKSPKSHTICNYSSTLPFLRGMTIEHKRWSWPSSSYCSPVKDLPSQTTHPLTGLSDQSVWLLPWLKASESSSSSLGKLNCLFFNFSIFSVHQMRRKFSDVDIIAFPWWHQLPLSIRPRQPRLKWRPISWPYIHSPRQNK